MQNELLLLSGEAVPFPEGRLTIHQPRLKEIALMGEDQFFTGFELLKFNRDLLQQQDKSHLEHLSDFDIFMQVLLAKGGLNVQQRMAVETLLMLMFPTYQIKFTLKAINFYVDGQNEPIGFINADNFTIFQDLLKAIFCAQELNPKGVGDMKPGGQRARQIAEKLKQRQNQLAKFKTDKPQKIALLSRYTSILAVGESKDLNSLMNYTVFQLFDEFKRYRLKLEHDMVFKLKCAGASSKDLKEPEDWMKDLYVRDSDDDKLLQK